MSLYHHASAKNMYWMGPRADLNAMENRKKKNNFPMGKLSPKSCPQPSLYTDRNIPD
jgi:hypothetical protein